MTRASDLQDGGERIKAARREGRVRTILYSAIIAGIVSLIVVRIGETQSYNEQVDRNRQNCQFQQDDLRDRADYLDEQADGVLGNKKKHIKPANFEIPPFSKFSDFKDVIVSQAVGNRKRATATRARIEDCTKVFPRRNTIPLIG